MVTNVTHQSSARRGGPAYRGERPLRSALLAFGVLVLLHLLAGTASAATGLQTDRSRLFTATASNQALVPDANEIGRAHV